MKTDLRVENLALGELRPDPHNPRTDTDQHADRDLAASIAMHGVKVPLLCFRELDAVLICDGHRRWRCSKAAGKDTVPCIVFPKRPAEDELLAVQLTIDAHRQNLNPMNQHDAFARLAALRNWTPTQLAEGLAISNTEVTRVLMLGKLSAEEQALVREGKVPKSSGYALARIAPEERHGLAQKVAAGEVTRDQLDAMARRKPQANGGAVRRVSCAIPGGTVSVSCGRELNLSTLAELFDGLARQCRKFKSQKLDLSTAMRVLHDQTNGVAEKAG